MSRVSYREVIPALLVGAGLSAAGLYLYQQRPCSPLGLLHPGVACAQAQDAVPYVTRDTSLHEALRERIEAFRSAGKLSHAAIAYRDLQTGAALGVDAESQFVPASLIKLPLAMAYFALGAEQPSLLEGEIAYAPEQLGGAEMLRQQEVAESGLEVGSRYPVEALLRATVKTSDNLAYYLIVQRVNQQGSGPAFKRMLGELGIVDPRTISDEVASPRVYAALLRLLYTASFLDVATSERLLSWLSESTYDKGIAAGLPEGVALANKFGERELDDGTLQLHDCGIVYHPTHPYALCVMTKGRNYAQLQEAIAELSGMLYAAVDGRAP